MSRSRLDLLLRHFLCMLLLLASSCAARQREPAMPYAKLAQMIGFDSDNGFPMLMDGDSVDLYVRDAATGPLDGVRLFLGDSEIHGIHGHFRIPISRALLSANPELRLVKPPGYEGELKTEFRALSAFSVDAGLSGFGERADLTDWKALSVGPDRIYLEPPMSESDAEHLVRLLEEARALLSELSSVSPPPIAIGLMPDTAPRRYARPDPEGRTVWLERAARARTPGFIGFIAHEWTHALLDQVGFPDDAELRYLEDGLAEIIGHLTEQRVLGVPATPTLERHRRELLALPSDRNVDLYALAKQYSVDRPQALEATLKRPGISDGYSLGMAYWYQRTQGQKESVRSLFDAWRRSMPSGADAFQSWLSDTGKSPRAFTVAEARAWLGAAPVSSH